LKPVLCPARQHNLVVSELEAVVTNNHQVRAHAQETTDRQNSVWLLAVACHQEVVNLADSFVCVVKAASTDELGRPKDGRHLLHIDLGNLYRLWNALCVCVCGEKAHANHCSTGNQHYLLHDYSPSWFILAKSFLRFAAEISCSADYSIIIFSDATIFISPPH